MKNFIALGLAVGISVAGAWYFSGSNASTATAINAEAAQQAANAFASAPSGSAPAAVASAPAVTEAMTAAPEQVNQAPAPTPVAPSAPTEEKKVTAATLHTNKGDISIQFSSSDAPNTVANFIKLASSGFYDGTKFHRVIKGFMIQGGDPLSKDDTHPELWGHGGPGYTFADEIGPNSHNDVGTVAMANSGPNTDGSQFFINVNNNNYLDGHYTVFGKVTAGADVVMAISTTATDSSDRPVDPVIVTSVTLQ